MRDLFFVAFLGAFFLLGLKRSFLLVLTYAYIDIVAPQRLSYFLLNSIPISAIAFGLAVVGWMIADDKAELRISTRQVLMIVLLAWCGYTTLHADFPVEALTKWAWVWKALVFAIFLPFTLRTRLRMEALALVMVLCASSIIITGGIKTLLSGGGYGVLNLMIDDNSGLYEGSTISTVAIAIIPLILWLTNYGTIFPPSRLLKLAGWALCGACLLIPIGTETRTGLLCILLLGGLMMMHMQRRIVYGTLIAIAAFAAIPFLPSSFTSRMDTIESYQSDESASTRVAVWQWTIQYVKDHPFGGGFDAYLSNSFRYEKTTLEGPPGAQTVERNIVVDHGRAYHSAYFEMLGEQGFFGFILWALIHGMSLARTEWIRRHYKRRDDPTKAWVAPLALALQQGHLVYLLGAAFVGIAFQTFVFMMLALQIALSTYLARQRRHEEGVPIFAPRPQSATA
ncbi:putative O-glycosylation ligase, exosortase A system-associated [Sphingobium sp. SCG-1]|uniref:putative O-glycosylation ligase, exosortase A system-associated n=1 Tax=Sphingobium sp. SCG-1 TaxID=2072936 RepID=UPI000CD6803F|nr:putative O-glycosylation ligase, exosortase A system-associated [Sphingobium sp. SCG-1]AUW59249.1 putative O-glycosylation ligase, exosortase A system-associated [Sphingobium sp. SCG-1]